MEHNPVVWFEIYGEDMARAKAFYEELLHTELEEAKMDGLEMWIFPHDIEKPGQQARWCAMKCVRPICMARWSIFRCRIAGKGKAGQRQKTDPFTCQKPILASMGLSPLLAIVRAIVSVCTQWSDKSGFVCRVDGYRHGLCCKPSGVVGGRMAAGQVRLFQPCR